MLTGYDRGVRLRRRAVHHATRTASRITSEEFRYLLKPTLTLAADYRFGYIDYFGVNNDSDTNFLLGGFDYTFSPRLRGQHPRGCRVPRLL